MTCIAHITTISSTMANFSSNVFGNYFTDEFGKIVSVGNQDTESWISPSQDCSKLFNNTQGITTTPFLKLCYKRYWKRFLVNLNLTFAESEL